jgi:hypothetical protein
MISRSSDWRDSYLDERYRMKHGSGQDLLMSALLAYSLMSVSGVITLDRVLIMWI